MQFRLEDASGPAADAGVLRELLASRPACWTEIVRVMARQYFEAVGPWQAYLPILR